jgi:hypothetical protein
MPVGEQYKRNARVGSALHKSGITPEQVTAYVKAVRGDPFYSGKVVSLETVAKNIKAWLETQGVKNGSTDEQAISEQNRRNREAWERRQANRAALNAISENERKAESERRAAQGIATVPDVRGIDELNVGYLKWRDRTRPPGGDGV